MAETTIEFLTVAGATTCHLASLPYSLSTSGQAASLSTRVVITNADVSQAATSGQSDDSGSAPVVGRRDTLITSTSHGFAATPVASTSKHNKPSSHHLRNGTGRRRRRSGLRVPRALMIDQDENGVADFFVSYTINTTLDAGGGALAWTVSVPEGYYVVTAVVNDPSLSVRVINAPRFYVGVGATTNCINPATFLPATASSTAGRQMPTQATVNAPTPPAGRPPLPIAAIVGIIIAGVVLIIILVLVCVWNKRERRKPIEPKLPDPVEQTGSSFFARDAGTLAGLTRATLAPQPMPPVPPLPSQRPAYVPYSQR